MEFKNINWKRVLDISVATVLVVGGLNWGLIGLFHVDLVAAVCGGMNFGETNILSRVIYSVVGMAAAFASYQVISLRGLKNRWNMKPREGPQSKSVSA